MAERPPVLFLFTPGGGHKGNGFRLLEWLVLYFIKGGIALGIEKKATGNIFSRDWEFHVITLCLFVIFALPGFLYHVELKAQLARTRCRRTQSGKPAS